MSATTAKTVNHQLPALLTAMAGGYFAGALMHKRQPHALIIAPKIGGEFVDVPWHQDGADVPGACSYIDGRANTEALAEAGSELARNILALEIGGFTDWSLPARDQLELMYRHAKPGTWENACTFRDGDNPSSVPVGYPYTPDSPAQTDNAAFQAGAKEALSETWYWASTQYSSGCAWGQYFVNGSQGLSGKECEARARAVRMIPLDHSVI